MTMDGFMPDLHGGFLMNVELWVELLILVLRIVSAGTCS